MTIIEEVIDTLSEQKKTIFTSKEIKELVYKKHGRNNDSVIPSDYCYNRINKGIKKITRPIFVRLDPNEYRYYGENYSYDGLIWQNPQGSKEEIVGRWEKGKPVYFEEKILSHTGNVSQNDDAKIQENLDIKQIEKLYEEYLSLLELEINVFGCKPTETRHLIGRIGEFKCALFVKGYLSKKTNQHGFDVISKSGEKISVKTTAQKSGGFVAINKNTIDIADELMVIQYAENEFEIIYRGPIDEVVKECRIFENKYEFDISKARKLQKKRNNL